MDTIVIIGPGALGCLLAARLEALGRHAVWLLDHNPERVKIINEKGVRLSEQGTVTPIFVPATTEAASIGRADLLLLCVKSYDVLAGLERARPLLHDSSLLVSFQNGIRHLDLLAAGKNIGPWALGVTAMGATGTGPGTVAFGGAGPTKIGTLPAHASQSAPLLEKTAATFSDAGIPTIISSKILNDIWAKLMVNVGINALTVIHDCANGRLLDISEARQQLTGAVREAESVARAKGITLQDDPVERTLEVCRATATNISSMLQDVRHRKPTEIDAINGAVAEEAHRLGIPTPINQELVRRTKTLEKGLPDSCPSANEDVSSSARDKDRFRID